MRPIDADVLKEHIDKLPALPDGNFAGNHSALKALINMQPTIQLEERTEKRTETHACDLISRQAAIDAVNRAVTQEVASWSLQELPSAQPEQHHDEWCTDCKEYDKERHCCPRFNRAIRTAMEDAGRWIARGKKLPEDQQKCLLILLMGGGKYVDVGTFSTDLYSVDKYAFADKKGVAGWYYRDSEYGFCEHYGVTAWMPLPDPYEPEE